jgi:hypothetical protein
MHEKKKEKIKKKQKIYQGKLENHVIIKIKGMENILLSQRGRALANSHERTKYRITR